MPAEYTYDYAIIRVVPRVERGERINAGVILSCADLHFLEARIELDAPAVLALDPAAEVRGHPGEPGDHPGRLSRWTGSRAHRRAAGPCAVPLARLAPQHERADVTRPYGAHRRRRCVPRAPDGHRREASGRALLRSGISLIARDSRANP